jgi:chaperone BCS1
MSGLLNATDGASSTKGRLLIVTTNHLRAHNGALTWPDRYDDKFHIGYATKNTAEQTFRCIFGRNPY